MNEIWSLLDQLRTGLRDRYRRRRNRFHRRSRRVMDRMIRWRSRVMIAGQFGTVASIRHSDRVGTSTKTELTLWSRPDSSTIGSGYPAFAPIPRSRSRSLSKAAYLARGWAPISLPRHPRPSFRQAAIEQFIELNDSRTLGFAEYGDPSGKPVLQFHGWPSCRFEGWNYDEAGKKAGARIIAIDRPGFGLSTYKKGYRIVDWPSDVLELADRLGLARFAVMGVSSGSAYALACARFIPERLTFCTLIGGMSPLKVKGEKVDPNHYIDPLEIHVARMANTAPLVAYAVFRYIACMIRTNPGLAMKQFMRGAPPSDLELLKNEAAVRNFQQSVAECCRNGIKGPVASVGLEMRDWGFRLQDITMNISLWHGELDNLVLPAAAKYMASKLPNHTLHLIPKAGHLTVITRHAGDVLRESLSAK
jgi:pimeloyl-ACP methyl ester carboxylesterase